MTPLIGKMIIPPKQVEEIMELTTFISCWVPTFYRYTDADRSAILRSINLVSSQYQQIHVIFLELEHVSENSKWQRRDAVWGTKRHGATLSITLALGLPSNFLNKLDYISSYCWPNTLNLTMSILKALFPTKSKKTVLFSFWVDIYVNCWICIVYLLGTWFENGICRRVLLRCLWWVPVLSLLVRFFLVTASHATWIRL